MKTTSCLGIGRVVAVVAGLMSATTAWGQYTVLHSFGGGASDGASPQGALTLVGDKLYGLTPDGGADGEGTLFAYDLISQTQAVEVSLDFTANGSTPMGSMAASGTTLYGFTQLGGNMFGGTIFAYDTVTEDWDKLHEFLMFNESEPLGTPLLSGSKLYGTTRYLGQDADGVFFSYDVDTDVFAQHGFGQGFHSESFVEYDSKFYASFAMDANFSSGETFRGGLYSVVFSPYEYDTIHLFPESYTTAAGDGSAPAGTPVVVDGKIYGVTESGGNVVGPAEDGSGAIYEYDPVMDAFDIVYSFAGGALDGAYPQSVIADGTTLYGLTNEGGANGLGTIFAYDIPTDTMTILHSFDGTERSSPIRNQLTLVGDTLYGMTTSGGANDLGTIFSFELSEPPVLGDTDGDGDVDFDDFVAVQNFFGEGGPDSPGDADGDGDCDFDDFVAVQNYFGTGAPGVVPTAVGMPEPGSVGLLLIGAMGLWMRRR